MLRVLPNIEAAVVAWLRTQPELSALGGRVYPGMLATETRPCVRVTRYGGLPAMQEPFELDTANLQIDVWGNTYAETEALAQTIRALLHARLPGVHAHPIPCIIYQAQLGALSNSPDIEYDPPWPRYITDLTITYRPPINQ